VGEREGLAVLWGVRWQVTDGRRPGGGKGQEVEPGVNRASDYVPRLPPSGQVVSKKFQHWVLLLHVLEWRVLFCDGGVQHAWMGARSHLIAYVGGRAVSRTIPTCDSLTAGLGMRVSARYCDCSFPMDSTGARPSTSRSPPTFLRGLVSTCQIFSVRSAAACQTLPNFSSLFLAASATWQHTSGCGKASYSNRVYPFNSLMPLESSSTV
jgi:hypothetical protein